MSEPLLFFLARWWPLAAAAYALIILVCFRWRKARWIAALWLPAMVPPVVLATRWVQSMGFKTSGPDAGWAAMGAAFEYLFLLPAVVTLVCLLIVMPRRMGWHPAAVVAGAGLMAWEFSVLQNWKTTPPTGVQVVFEVKNPDGSPVKGVYFSQDGTEGFSGRTPGRAIEAGADGLIKTSTDPMGGLNGQFRADGMGQVSVFVLAIGSEDVPGRRAFSVTQSWFLEAGEIGIHHITQSYTTEVPEAEEIRCTVYLRPLGSFVTLPYWKELAAATGRFTHEHHHIRLWRGAVSSTVGSELIELCRRLLAGGSARDRRIAMDAAQTGQQYLQNFREQCVTLQKMAQSPNAEAKDQDMARDSLRAILAWAEIPTGGNEDPAARFSSVPELLDKRIAEWRELAAGNAGPPP